MRRCLSLTSLKNHYRSRVSHQLQKYVLKSIRDLLLLAIEFFIENTTVQIISSVKHNQVPLRDLAYEALSKFMSIKTTCNPYRLSVESVAMIWILFSFCNGTEGLRVIQKGVRCLFIARILRVMLFSMTILPSPKLHCRFTNPINPFKVYVGGGCNDLLYSGHVTVYTMTAITFTVLSQRYHSRILRYGLPILIWLHVIQLIVCTILQRHHYSIDMFLGCVVTLLIWQCKPLHLDLPKVPENLFLHLKQLAVPQVQSMFKEV